MNASKNKAHAYNKTKFIPHIIDDTFVFDTYSVDDLHIALDFIKKEGINLLMISGGDGTLQVTITELLKQMDSAELPIILPLRGGAMNMVVNNFGMRKNPVEAVRILMKHFQAYNRGEEKLATIPMRILKVTDAGGVKYGFTFSNGIAYKVLKLYYASGQPGFQTAVNAVTNVIGGFVIGSPKYKKYFEKIKVHIEIDGKLYPHDKILISVASVLKKLVLWFKPFYEPEKKGIDDFYFLAAAIKPIESITKIRTLSSGKLQHDKVFNNIVHKVRIKAAGGYNIDGELTDGAETDVTIEPSPVLNFYVVPETIRTNMMGVKFRHYLNGEYIVNHGKDFVA